MQVINIEHHLSRASHKLSMFFKVKDGGKKACTVVHKPLMGKSVWQTTEVSMTVTVYYSDTSVRKQMTHAKLRLVFLTPRLLSALTSTQTAFIHKDSICCVQKNQVHKYTGFQGPNSCWIFSPCLGPAARKISQEKSGQSQQKQAADLAESSLTGLGKCRFELLTIIHCDLHY